MLDDLMGTVLGGAGSQSDQDSAEGGDQLANLLGALMEGGTGQQGGDAGDLLGSLLGGSSSGAAGMGGLLNAVMGGGGADTGISSLLAPATDHLAKKLGVPPEMARMIVMFVVGKLLSSQMRGGAGATRSGGLTGQDDVDLDDLMARMSSDQGLDPDYFKSTGLAEELSQQTGLDSDAAAQGLQEAFEMLGGQLGAGQQ